MITNILIATDGSEEAIRAVQYGLYLVQNLGCKVTLVHVVEIPPLPRSVTGTVGISEESRRNIEEELWEAGRSIIRLSQKPMSDAGVVVNYEVLEGRPADVICKYAEEGKFDLVIIGNRGRGMVSRMLLGSVSSEVIKAASVPVLVVRK